MSEHGNLEDMMRMRAVSWAISAWVFRGRSTFLSFLGFFAVSAMPLATGSAAVAAGASAASPAASTAGLAAAAGVAAAPCSHQAP